MLTFLLHVGGLKNLILNDVPQFQMENGRLEAEAEMSLDIGATTIYMNTDYDEISLSDLETNGVYIAFGKENVVMGMVNGTETYEYSNIKLDTLFYDGFNNEQLASSVPAFYIALGIIYIIMMLGDGVELVFFGACIFHCRQSACKGTSYRTFLWQCLTGMHLRTDVIAAAYSCKYLYWVFDSVFAYVYYHIIFCHLE